MCVKLATGNLNLDSCPPHTPQALIIVKRPMHQGYALKTIFLKMFYNGCICQYNKMLMAVGGFS